MEAAVHHKNRLALLVVSVAVTLITIWTVAGRPPALRASGMAPLLPLNIASGELSFIGAAFRDPEALRHRPEDEHDASRLAQEIKEFRSDLSRAQGARAQELHSQAYLGYAALAYYLEDVAAGVTQGERSRARQQLETVRNFLVTHATAAAKLSQDPSERSRALYHALATQYLSGRDRARAAQGLRDLSTRASKLSPALKERAEFGYALYNLDSGREQRAALQIVTRSARSMQGAGAVAARMAAARGYAGLAADGRKIARTEPAYRAQLAAAARAAEGLSPAQKDETLALIIGIWRRAEGGNDWSKVPFNMSAFAGSIAVKGIVERAALADWHQGKYTAALRKYQGLAKGLNGQSLRGDIDLRILDMQRSEYLKSRNPKPYESELLAKQKAYLDPELLGSADKTKAVAAEIEKRHAMLVYGEMSRVAIRSASSAERSRAIAMGQTFVAMLGDTKTVATIKEKMAQLYGLNGQHREAVSIYRELAEAGTDAKKFYGLAIASQSILARWPVEAPWRGFSDGDGTARSELLAFYEKYAEAGGGARNWSIVAQQGLLMIALSKPEQAFSLWSLQLKQDARGPHAAHAAGYMLVAYQKAQSWDALEDVARQCLTANLSPLHRGSPVSAAAALGLALLEGGSQALQENQYALAVKKLNEFVNKHGNHARHDEGMFKLAHAYRGNGKYKDSIAVLTSFVERHPNSKYRRDALLAGGDWSAPMAYEENAMFFYQKFLASFSQDPEADRVRVTVTELYIGRGLYQQATAMLMARVEAPGVSAAEKSQALATVLDLEERHGSLARADRAADMLLAASDAMPEHKADALALKADLAAKKGNLAQLAAIENQLAGLTAGPQVTEALGHVRLLMASAKSRDLVQEYFNLELKDPLKTLSERHNAWQQVRTAYDAVCVSGATSSCASAMHDLARLAVQFLRSIEDVEVQATLAQDVVRKFQSQKQFVYNEVAKAAQRADAKALAAVRRGEGSPDTTQAVLWQNAADWNFERVSGEAGNAYVQWSTRSTVDAE